MTATAGDSTPAILETNQERTVAQVTGTPGDDVLFATGEDDQIFADAGNDTIYGSAGGFDTDRVNGGTGSDAMVYGVDPFFYITADGKPLIVGFDGRLDILVDVEQVQVPTPEQLIPIDYSSLEYIASYPDLMDALGIDRAAAINHFAYSGFDEGRWFNFDGLEYIASYGDLIAAFGANADAGAAHYITAGRFEGRVPDLFDAEQYLANYSDLQDAFLGDLELATLHYIQSGYFEGRTDALV
jgi:hypothetical protein